MKLLICGGRDFRDYEKFKAAMAGLPFSPLIIIHGGARGADIMGTRYGREKGIHYAEVPALWDHFKKRAGSLRNTAMALLNPDYCLAMPGGSGTADMVRICKEQKIVTWRPYG